MKNSTGSIARRTNVRWQIAALAGVGVAITNIDRSTISVALPFMSKDLHIAPLFEGLVLGWFFLAYAIFLLPAGVIVDKFGARMAYGVGAIVWGVATVATAGVNGIASLLGLRLMLGIGEAAQYPSCITATTAWFPDKERGAATAVWDVGARVGGVLTLPLIATIIAWAGWRMAFVVAGGLALVWTLGWFIQYRQPSEHRRVNAAELEHITSGARVPVAATSGAESVSVKWRHLFRFRSTWGLMIGYFCFNYVAYFFITWFPSYLVSARGFSLLTLGIFGMIPGICAILSELISGFTQDHLITRGADKNRVRKSFLVIGMICASSIAFAVIAPTAWLALLLLSFSYGALMLGAPTLGTLPAEFAPTPRHIGSLGGIQNCAGNIAGFLGPIVTGAIVMATGNFVLALVSTGIIAVVGALNYIFIVPRITTGRPSLVAAGL